MNRYFSSFIATTLIYTLLLTSVLYSFNDENKIASKPKQSLNNIKFTVLEQQPVKKVEKPVKKTVEKKVVKKIVKKEPPKKTPKKKIKKVVKKEKKPVKKVVKKIQKPEKKITKKDIKKKVEKKAVKKQMKQQKKIVKKPENSLDEDLINAKKRKYFKTIKATISKNKRYPKIAVRRGIQGEVEVHLTISKEGELVHFDIVKGNKVFKKSIKKAMEETFPIKPPENLIISKTDLTLTLSYKLY